VRSAGAAPSSRADTILGDTKASGNQRSSLCRMHALPDREVQSKISGPEGAQMLSYTLPFPHDISAHWWAVGAPFGTPFLAAPETRSTELHAWQVV